MCTSAFPPLFRNPDFSPDLLRLIANACAAIVPQYLEADATLDFPAQLLRVVGSLHRAVLQRIHVAYRDRRGGRDRHRRARAGDARCAPAGRPAPHLRAVPAWRGGGTEGTGAGGCGRLPAGRLSVVLSDLLMRSEANAFPQKMHLGSKGFLTSSDSLASSSGQPCPRSRVYTHAVRSRAFIAFSRIGQ